MAEERGKKSGHFGCQEFHASLTTYLEGEEDSDVRVHAGQCASCGSLLGDLECIRSAAKDWPLETPSPRVWSNIRAALAQEGLIRERESSWRRWMAQISFVPRTAPVTALTFALVLAMILAFRGDIRRNGAPAPSLAPVAASIVPVGLSGVQTNVARTVQEMEGNYKAHEASLDPSAKQIYQAGLASLNNSIQECLDSLQKQPHNILAQEYLMQAYSQKAEVLASAMEYGGR